MPTNLSIGAAHFGHRDCLIKAVPRQAAQAGCEHGRNTHVEIVVKCTAQAGGRTGSIGCGSWEPLASSICATDCRLLKACETLVSPGVCWSCTVNHGEELFASAATGLIGGN